VKEDVFDPGAEDSPFLTIATSIKDIVSTRETPDIRIVSDEKRGALRPAFRSL
jgi:hypothetical protein